MKRFSDSCYTHSEYVGELAAAVSDELFRVSSCSDSDYWELLTQWNHQFGAIQEALYALVIVQDSAALSLRNLR